MCICMCMCMYYPGILILIVHRYSTDSDIIYLVKQKLYDGHYFLDTLYEDIPPLYELNLVGNIVM